MGLSHFLAIIIDAMILNINLCGNSASLIRYRSFFFWLGVDNFATKKQNVRVDIPSNTVISPFSFFFCCCCGFFLFFNTVFKAFFIFLLSPSIELYLFIAVALLLWKHSTCTLPLSICQSWTV